jgi:hypothetical protein
LAAFPPKQEEMRVAKETPMRKIANDEEPFSFFISSLSSIRNTRGERARILTQTLSGEQESIFCFSIKSMGFGLCEKP